MLCICFALVSHYSFPVKRFFSSMNRCAIQCNVKRYHLSSTNDILIFSSNICIACLHCFHICALHLDLELKLGFFFNSLPISWVAEGNVSAKDFCHINETWWWADLKILCWYITLNILFIYCNVIPVSLV